MRVATQTVASPPSRAPVARCSRRVARPLFTLAEGSRPRVPACAEREAGGGAEATQAASRRPIREPRRRPSGRRPSTTRRAVRPPWSACSSGGVHLLLVSSLDRWSCRTPFRYAAERLGVMSRIASRAEAIIGAAAQPSLRLSRQSGTRDGQTVTVVSRRPASASPASASAAIVEAVGGHDRLYQRRDDAEPRGPRGGVIVPLHGHRGLAAARERVAPKGHPDAHVRPRVEAGGRRGGRPVP